MKWFGGFLLLCLLFVTNISFFGSSYSKTAYYVVVDKSDYELKVYDGEGWLIKFISRVENKQYKSATQQYLIEFYCSFHKKHTLS
jgi:hypothetical protein